jgi:tRNA C32,U32 (ribose-2'-O)-methylase TrmJ
MDKAKGVIEMDLNGKVMSKTGEFETETEENIDKLTKNIFYILQDIHNIKTKNASFGNFQKLTIRANQAQYEIAIGATVIKIFKFNKN